MKKVYVSPRVEIEEVKVERGFALSDENSTEDLNFTTDSEGWEE